MMEWMIVSILRIYCAVYFFVECNFDFLVSFPVIGTLSRFEGMYAMIEQRLLKYLRKVRKFVRNL
jgi:hypothetical protein